MLRYALVGCGRISGIHLDAVARHYKENKIKLVALCDIMEEKALLAKESYISKTNETEVNCYTSMDEMLDKEELDVIAVCTPSGMHPEHGIKAAKKGIHVLTEKPMGCDLEEVDNLIKACEENNVKLFVVKQKQAQPHMLRPYRGSRCKSLWQDIHGPVECVLVQRTELLQQR